MKWFRGAFWFVLLWGTGFTIFDIRIHRYGMAFIQGCLTVGVVIAFHYTWRMLCEAFPSSKGISSANEDHRS